MNLTSLQILNIVKDWIKGSPFGEAVPTIYTDHYPQFPTNRSVVGEFVVLNVLSNAVGDGQAATVNVNIYVPDLSPRIGAVAQRYPNRERLSELCNIAYDSLKGYPVTERWFFDVSSETLISEQGIPYSFANIKVTLKRF